MSSCQDLGFFFVYNNPKAEAQSCYVHAALNYKTEREPVLTPLGFCLRVLVNEKPKILKRGHIVFYPYSI